MSERGKLALAGWLTLALGLLPLLSAFNVIATDDSDFGAPRWLVAAIGQVFVVLGAWLVISRAPDGPLAGLLRVFAAPLLHGLCALFCTAIVLWPHRVTAGPEARAFFVVLAGIFALATGHALFRVGREAGARSS